MRIDCPVLVRLARFLAWPRACVLPALMVAAALLSTGCGSVGSAAVPAVQQAADNPLQPPVDGRPRVLLPGKEAATVPLPVPVPVRVPAAGRLREQVPA